jgi:hypothetical protein
MAARISAAVSFVTQVVYRGGYALVGCANTLGFKYNDLEIGSRLIEHCTRGDKNLPDSKIPPIQTEPSGIRDVTLAASQLMLEPRSRRQVFFPIGFD